MKIHIKIIAYWKNVKVFSRSCCAQLAAAGTGDAHTHSHTCIVTTMFAASVVSAASVAAAAQRKPVSGV